MGADADVRDAVGDVRVAAAAVHRLVFLSTPRVFAFRAQRAEFHVQSVGPGALDAHRGVAAHLARDAVQIPVAHHTTQGAREHHLFSLAPKALPAVLRSCTPRTGSRWRQRTVRRRGTRHLPVEGS